MNKKNREFLEKNGINVEKIRETQDCSVKSQDEINSIVYRYGFQEGRRYREISVADIVGRDSFWNDENNTDIFESMDSFFEENSDGYHMRSLGMLEYNKDNIIENLRTSFKIEPIEVCETGEGQYVISSNGLHRFTVLRIMYLKELYELGKNPEEQKVEQLRAKYTIPVDVTTINLDNTYCKYMMEMIDGTWEISRDFDLKTRKTTGKIVLKSRISAEKMILSTEELKNMIKERMNEIVEYYFLFLLSFKRYASFRKFVEQNLPELAQKIMEQERGELESEY